MATAIPGNTDVVTHAHDGLLVPAGDEAAWAAALERLLTEQELRASLAAAARQTILDRFALEQTVRQYAQLYQQLGERAKRYDAE